MSSACACYTYCINDTGRVDSQANCGTGMGRLGRITAWQLLRLSKSPLQSTLTCHTQNQDSRVPIFIGAAVFVKTFLLWNLFVARRADDAASASEVRIPEMPDWVDCIAARESVLTYCQNCSLESLPHAFSRIFLPPG